MNFKFAEYNAASNAHLPIIASKLAAALQGETAAGYMPQAGQLPSALSEYTNALIKPISEMKPQTHSGAEIARLIKKVPTPPLAQKLRAAMDSVQRELAAVSMYFSDELITRLTSRINQFHNPETWDTDKQHIQVASIKTFIHWYYPARPEKLPSFGMSPDGFLTASWMANFNKDQLILEFLPKDKIRWYVTLYNAGQTQYANGDNVPLADIGGKLQPFGERRWFSKR